MSKVLEKKEVKEVIDYKIYYANVNDSRNVIIVSTKDDKYKHYIYLGSTSNCQLTVLGNVDNCFLHHSLKPKSEKEAIIYENKLATIIKNNSNRQILIDVIDSKFDNIIEIFKRNSDDFHIIIKESYQNSTGTDMILCMFKWDKLDLDPDHPDYEDEYEWDDDD